MNERLDYLLSIELDGELDANERSELDRLLADHPEATQRRQRFAAIDGALRAIGAQPTRATSEDALNAGLASLHERIEASASHAADESEEDDLDELARRRGARSRWLPSIGLAAAAALALYLVVPGSSIDPFGESTVGPTGTRSAERRGSPSTDTNAKPGDRRERISPIALAVVFELEEDGDGVPFGETVSAEDFEIIEQLELLEFMATREARETGGRG